MYNWERRHLRNINNVFKEIMCLVLLKTPVFFRLKSAEVLTQ